MMIRAFLVVGLVASAGGALAQEDLYRLRRAPEEPLTLAASEALAFEIEPRVDLVLAGKETLALPQPEGGHWTVRREAHQASGSSVSWSGRLIGTQDGTVVLSVHQGLLSGAIYTRDATWILRPTPDRSHVLTMIDRNRFADCGQTSSPLRSLAVSEVSPPRGKPPTPVIDILGLYTVSARQGAGGVAQIEALILNAAAVTNTAFANSGIVATVNIVEMAEIDLTQFPVFADLHEAIVGLQGDAGIAALRDAVDADLVAAIFENGGGFCGYANIMDDVGLGFAPAAYSISTRECAVANLTFPHEIGHNLGGEHNPADTAATPETELFPWSFGHFVIGDFRTVMSVFSPCGVLRCARVPYFSNPHVTVNGHAAGIEGARENHLTLNATAPVAAAFRVPGLIFRDGFENGSFEAWSGATAR